MARFNHAANNFLSGEVSPKILARGETQEYKQACEELLNMLPYSQGGVERRPGSQFVASQLNSASIRSETKLFPFNISNSESYIIAITRETNAYSTSFKAYAINTSTLSEYAVTLSSGWSPHIPSDSDLDTLSVAQYGDFLFFAGANVYPFVVFRTALNTISAVTRNFPFSGLPTTLGDYLPYRLNSTPAILTLSAVAVGAATLTLTPGTSGYLFDSSMYDSLNVGNTFFAFVDGANYGFAYVTGYTSTTSLSVQITKACPAGFTGGLTTWFESYWSKFRGYPRTVCFYDQRSVYSGSSAYPNYVWGSQLANIHKFVDAANQIVTGTVTNSMPFLTQIASSENTQVQWVSSGKKITTGTGGREYQVFGPDTTQTIGATNVGSNAETSHGSDYVQPARLDSAVLFVQRSGKKVMEYVFDLREESYRVRDLSTIADHMVYKGIDRFATFTEPRFKKLQYSGANSVIWVLDTNGVLTSITRDRTTDSLAWTEHDIGGDFGGENAVVMSIAVANSGDGSYDDLWMIVKRTINSSTVYYIERINRPFYAEELTGSSTSILDKPVYVDSSKLVQVSPANTVFTGFSHLIGQTVSCLADGLYHGEKVVDGSGQITLDTEATELVAGLKYTSKITPVVPDAGVVTGSSLARPKKMDKVAVRFHRTVGAQLVRKSDGVSEDIIFRTADLAGDDPIPLFSGFKDLDFPGTGEKDEKLTIQTELPLPMGILGIFIRGTSND